MTAGIGFTAGALATGGLGYVLHRHWDGDDVGVLSVSKAALASGLAVAGAGFAGSAIASRFGKQAIAEAAHGAAIAGAATAAVPIAGGVIAGVAAVLGAAYVSWKLMTCGPTMQCES